MVRMMRLIRKRKRKSQVELNQLAMKAQMELISIRKWELLFGRG
jgi:aryl carrier-like protein